MTRDIDALQPSCPKCGAGKPARILYGMPDDTDELKRDLAAERVVLGGCVEFGEDPIWHCHKCDHQWGALPS